MSCSFFQSFDHGLELFPGRLIMPYRSFKYDQVLTVEIDRPVYIMPAWEELPCKIRKRHLVECVHGSKSSCAGKETLVENPLFPVHALLPDILTRNNSSTVRSVCIHIKINRHERSLWLTHGSCYCWAALPQIYIHRSILIHIQVATSDRYAIPAKTDLIGIAKRYCC